MDGGLFYHVNQCYVAFMKHVLIATQCFPPNIGGIEHLMSILANHLVIEGCRVSVLADGADPKEQLPAGLCVDYFNQPKWLRRLQKRRRFKKTLSENTIDAVFFDSWKSAEYLSDLVTRPVRKIVYAHGNELLKNTSTNHQLRIHHALQSCHNIIAVSQSTSDLVEPFVSRSSSIQVIHNPAEVPDQWCQPRAMKPIQRWITVARLEPRKGIDMVLEALSKLVENSVDIHYTIVGQGSDESRLRQLCQTYQLTNHVTFAGRVDEAQKFDLLHQSDAFVMPTRHEVDQRSIEGLGIAFIEAMAVGLPVIAGKEGGIKDIIQHQDTGWICDGNSAESVQHCMRQVMDNINQTYLIAQKGQVYVQTNLTPSKYIEKIFQLF